jgi:hypothetical protein
VAEVYTLNPHHKSQKMGLYVVNSSQLQAPLCVEGDNQRGLGGKTSNLNIANLVPNDLGLKGIASVLISNFMQVLKRGWDKL